MTFLKKIAAALAVLITVGALAACSSTQPKYDAKEPLGPQINYTITGIDAGAGVMTSTDKALKAYGLVDKKWQLQPSFHRRHDQYVAKGDCRQTSDCGHWLDAALDVHQVSTKVSQGS